MKSAGLLAVAAVAAPSAAEAFSGGYLKFEGGAGFSGDLTYEGLPSLDFEPGYQLGGGVGYDFEGPFRLEGEVLYVDNAVDDMGTGLDLGISAIGGFANVYADFGEGNFRPYVGVGVGYVDGELNLSVPGFGTLTDSDTAIGLQARVGAAFDITENVALDVGYRMFTAEFEASEATLHGVAAALRIRFGGGSQSAGNSRSATNNSPLYTPSPPAPPQPVYQQPVYQQPAAQPYQAPAYQQPAPQPYQQPAPQQGYGPASAVQNQCQAVFEERMRERERYRSDDPNADAATFRMIYSEYERCTGQ